MSTGAANRAIKPKLLKARQIASAWDELGSRRGN